MTTHDNQPATDTPDFTCPAGNTCSGCAASANLCHVSRSLDAESPCCGSCSHAATVGPSVQTGARDIVYPVAYYGD